MTYKCFDKLILILVLLSLFISIPSCITATENVTKLESQETNLIEIDSHYNTETIETKNYNSKHIEKDNPHTETTKNKQNMEIITDKLENTNTKDIYFNTTALKNGNGTKENPYKNDIYDNYITNNSRIHLTNGEYYFKGWQSKTNISIYGEDAEKTIINGAGHSITIDGNLILKNITLLNLQIYNKNKGGTLQANNTIFHNYTSNIGPIYSIIKHYNIYLNNCTFKNSYATYNGAIYATESNLDIINTQFINITSNNDGGTIRLNNGNITIKNSNFINTSSKNNGGTIYLNNGNITINNSTFTKTHADNNGGAIYLNSGSMNITDSKFSNNTAHGYGGAIAYENEDKYLKNLNIQRTQFINDSSIIDAGGAIYLRYASFNAEDITISSAHATFGGAISSLKTNLNMTRIILNNNTAKYDGGAIYQIHSTLSINNSTLSNNNAENGGAIYLIFTVNATINNTQFNNNQVTKYGKTIYSILNQNTTIENNTYDTNPTSTNELYETLEIITSLPIGDYKLYHVNITDNELPTSYDLRDYNLTTIPKDQETGGNCWVFSAIGALESAILKASGEILDLSEENMKNLMALYSPYGLSQKETNDGGFNDMAISYLVSWLGPVYEEEDPYNEASTLSTLLPSKIHVQNVAYLKRNNYTDNDAIKDAIMKYGAVGTSMYYDDSYLNINAYYYKYGQSTNHGVLIIGWNDTYSRNNFKNDPGMDGAWIVKNSWGPDWGEDGYFYVSYYDTAFATVNKSNISFVFILNDTLKYDKNYQYDIFSSMEHCRYYTNNTSWYKNVFNSTDNEFLTSVSTYFLKDTNWNLTINVNNIQTYTQIGFSKIGYYTINLNQMIPLTIGDTFEVIFKITTTDTALIPVSSKSNLNYLINKRNISFISNNGLNWYDLYNKQEVACIKAFTILNPVDTLISLDISNMTENTVDLIATVHNQYGYLVNSGNVTFKIGDKHETVSIINGIAKLNTIFTDIINVNATFNAIGYTSSSASKLISALVTTKLDLSISSNHNPTNITAYVTDLENNPINSGSVIFNDGYKNYTVDLINGFANLTNIFLKVGENHISAKYQNVSYYNSSSNNISITISLLESQITLNTNSTENPIEIIANVTDLDGNPINSGSVKFNISNEILIENVINGIAKITHYFSQLGLNKIYASYIDNQINTTYNESTTSKSIDVIILPKDTKITITSPTPGTITIKLTDNENNPIPNADITYNINNKPNQDGKTNTDGTYTITDLTGQITLTATYQGNTTYNENTTTQTFNFPTPPKNTKITITSPTPGTITIKLTDNENNPIKEVTITYTTTPGTTQTQNTNEKGEITITDLTGQITINATYQGNTTYNENTTTQTFNFPTPEPIPKGTQENTTTQTSKTTQQTTEQNSNKKTSAPQIIIAKNLKVKKSTKNLKIKVKLKKLNKKILKNKKLTLKLKGKTYKAKTNKKGIATFKIPRKAVQKLKVGKTYKYTIKYRKYKLTKKITIKK